jgi:hypothetical protein
MVGESTPAQPDPYRVYVTSRRIVLCPPCCVNSRIVLERAVTDLQLVHEVVCRPCGRGWKVSFLAERCYGLRVSWREATGQ